MSAWIAPQSPPDDAARIAELRAELAARVAPTPG